MKLGKIRTSLERMLGIAPDSYDFVVVSTEDRYFEISRVDVDLVFKRVVLIVKPVPPPL